MVLAEISIKLIFLSGRKESSVPLLVVQVHFMAPMVRLQAFTLYKTYTIGQLRIKTVFQNNNIQDSFHAFLFIFLFFFFFLEFLSRVQSSIRGG